MSARDAAPAPHRLEESKFQIFIEVAMILAVITSLEIITVYLPATRAVLFWALAIMSAVKFALVISVFMHLRWDKALCTIVFLIGLVLAGGTMWALLRLFGAAASVPLTSS
jgi:cytochrome c oxidase subunit 4